jgi:hypothetical protein
MRKTFLLKALLGAGIVALAAAAPSDAAHPLITDDTGTQGAGKFQIEVNGEYGRDRETAGGVESTTRSTEAATTLSYGLTEMIDGVIGVPYLWVETHETDLSVPSFTHSSEKGLSDLSIEIKWRFYEKDGLSLAFKPGISVPTGNEQKGLGTGKYGFGAFFIATEEFKLLTFHQNIGYIRNNNRFDERENIYRISLACEYDLVEGLRLVANIGQERNPDVASKREPAFGLVGMIYGITENLDVDAGIKVGISDPETDMTALAGMAIRF